MQKEKPKYMREKTCVQGTLTVRSMISLRLFPAGVSCTKTFVSFTDYRILIQMYRLYVETKTFYFQNV